MIKTTEEIVMSGDLTQLSTEQRIEHYHQVCDALGLNAATHPLEYFDTENFKGEKTVILYVLRTGTDQLRKIHGINTEIVKCEIIDDICLVTVKATDKNGRTDSSIGAVSLKGKNGKDRANQIMAAQTKGTRRVTLSISGVGLLDESEVADMNSTTTTVTPGIQVSAPPQMSTPVVNNGTGTEVALAHSSYVSTPTPIVGRDPRIDMYKNEVLQAGGIQSKQGQSIGAKWVKFVLTLAGIKSTKEMTPELWKPVLDKLDEVRAKTGDKGVVLFIEETISKETI